MKTVKTAFIAVCSKEYLPQYRVLYKSIKKHITNARVSLSGEYIYADPILYLTDRGTETYPEFEKVRYVGAWLENSHYTDPFYQHCAIRPRAVLDAFSMGYDRVVLLGADTEFFRSPDLCFSSLDDNDCFVTMYIHEPYEGDQSLFGNNLQVLENGQINADLCGFKNTPQVIKFLTWLDEVLKTGCYINGKVYVDQAWISMCFSFLDKVKVIRNSGYNVAHYNMFQRGMHWERTGLRDYSWLMKDGSPLVLFHYAGFVKGQEERISKHQNRYKAEGDILEFMRSYSKRI